MTVVKICGLTNLDDALCAVEAGADMLGFIFYLKSPRYVHPEVAQQVVQQVRLRAPHIVTVGVFVNETAQMMKDVLDTVGLDLAQLSGDELPEVLAQLSGRGYKAVRKAERAQAFLQHASGSGHEPVTPDLLLDADHPTLYGGSGIGADQSLAVQVAQQCRVLLAGGLRPGNVAEAIHVVHPWGVDVASGVEVAPGKKDHKKVRAFIHEVRNACLQSPVFPL